MDIIINQIEPLLVHIKFIPTLLWTTFLSLIEWIVPGSWYAKKVDQDIVLITGAGSGLGRALAVEYAKLNSSLVLWDINEKGLEETKKLVDHQHQENLCFNNIDEEKYPKTEDYKRICLIYKVDVSDRVEVQKYAERVNEDLNIDLMSNQKERYVTVLINNAGIYHGLLLHELRDDQIERIFKINILAHFWTVRAFLPKMIKYEKGHIVEIASMGGISGLLKQVDYCATKFATVGFEESLSIELDHLGLGDKIHTTAVCPFFFSSNLFTGFDSSVTSLMSVEFVARETVMAMRCNHSRVLLPKFRGYMTHIMKSSLSRKSMIGSSKALKYAESISNIKGTASQ